MTRGLSQAALAEQVMYSRSLVNLVENGYRRATDAFARAADTALDAAGQLHAVWMSAAAADHVPTVPTRHHRMGAVLSPAPVLGNSRTGPSPTGSTGWNGFLTTATVVGFCVGGPLRDLPRRGCAGHRTGAACAALIRGITARPAACTAPMSGVPTASPTKWTSASVYASADHRGVPLGRGVVHSPTASTVNIGPGQ
ncbi:hypothetical protein GCM10027610_105700 [Dactylosporangium cerinum]